MNQIGMKRLTERQQELLAQMVVGATNVATFAGEQISDWKALKTVMVALGRKWKTKVGFEFPDDVDAAEILRIARESGVIFDPEEADFYPTPAELVEQVCDWAELAPGMSVLEPSAGRGALALMANEGYDCKVFCVEPLVANRDVLRKHRLSFAATGDFLLLAPTGPFDRVIMNPPFSKRADILHVQHALLFLKPGGILVAIMSAGVGYRQDRLTTEFHALVKANCGEIRDNPDGSFKHVGTMVKTVMVKMRKAG